MTMKSRLIALLLGLLIVAEMSHAQRKEVIGYLPSWKWREKNCLLTYDKIPFGKLTIIDYAFWRPLPDGTIEPLNPTGDSLILRGAGGATPLVPLAHENGVKVMLSVGGWDDSENFPAVASTEKNRMRFAHSCVAVLGRYEFDGIDVDWEYPGFPDHKGSPADKANSTRLLQILRDSLDAFGRMADRKILLSAAFAATEEHVTGYDMAAIAPFLDMVDIMTYDYSGSWTPVSGHNSPLYASAEGESASSIDASYRLFTQKYGVAPAKINLGIPFYGHSFAECIELGSAFKGSDTTLAPEGDLVYTSILPHIAMHRHWDNIAKVPYLILPEKRVLVSYDDEESVALKASYVVGHGARGVIIWEITGDYTAEGKTPLLDAIDSVFSGRSFPHQEGKQ
ncbi:MAG TPA: glycosyl hydrolase family 18 protein [Bacteroidota bacterium]|nr:glycosyl hydrolase family 18 protein [Bacteroidota bacterium]